MIRLTTNIIVGLTFFLALVWLLRKAYSYYSRLPLPPGPLKLPLIGHLLQIPSSREHEVYRLWGEQYGSCSGIIHVETPGVSLLVINNAKAASDLLEKRSRIYSDRPPAPMAVDLMGWNWNFGLLPYSDAWRSRRRVFLQSFNAQAAKLFRPHETKSAHLLLTRLRESPENFLVHLRYHAVRTIMSVAYGIEVKGENDPWVALVEAAVKPVIDAIVPGAFLVDSFPFLKHVPSWVPGAGFKRKAQKWKEMALSMVNRPFAAGKEMMHSDKYIPSFISRSLQDLDDSSADYEEKETCIRQAAGVIYAAGVESSAAALSSFLFAMTISPEAQCKAQEEIDRVAPGRLPTFEDEQSMPYVTAVVWESLRWKNVAPLGAAHYLDVEDEYEGHRIPKGTVVISNLWAILHDESLYPEPFEFKPERYFKAGSETEFDETVKDPRFAVFGYGRRICPGRHMAYSSLWISIASILKTFNISKAVDEHGNVIEPVYEAKSSILAMPSPFEFSMKPRSAEAEELIATASNGLEV
uniref:Cytochrome P450 n=3 Tax=Moniliophthora roreri TaxID=221103 RepID=A0A0W0FF05_MONRR